MLPSPKGSEGDHAPDILRSITTDRILAAIDEEIARLKKVRALLSTSTAADKDNTASPVRKRRKLSAVCPEEDRRRAAEALGPSKREAPPGSRSDFTHCRTLYRPATSSAHRFKCEIESSGSGLLQHCESQRTIGKEHLSEQPVLRPGGLELENLADISLPICCRRVHWR
jgi:hypothetical protein